MEMSVLNVIRKMRINERFFHKIGIHISRRESFPFFRLSSRNKFSRRLAVIKAKKYFKDKPITACEIGTFRGNHAEEMLKSLNIKKLYIIDPYEKYLEYKNDGSCKFVDEAKIEAHKRLKKYGKNTQIVWIEKFSDDAINDIKEKLDFLYIDGNHYSPFVDNDIKNYYPLVRKGGIISGHDYNNSDWKDVVNAVNRFARKNNKEISHGIGTDWVIFK